MRYWNKSLKSLSIIAAIHFGWFLLALCLVDTICFDEARPYDRLAHTVEWFYLAAGSPLLPIAMLMEKSGIMAKLTPAAFVLNSILVAGVIRLAWLACRRNTKPKEVQQIAEPYK